MSGPDLHLRSSQLQPNRTLLGGHSEAYGDVPPVVVRIVAPAPATHPCEGLTKLTEVRFSTDPTDCGVHVRPPSVVLMTEGASP